MTEMQAAQRGRPAVIGVSADWEDQLGSLVTDTSELSEGMLADVRVTLIGLEPIKGGETRESNRIDPNTGLKETYVTPDQVCMHLRVDGWEDIGLESDTIQQYFNLPRANERNGKIVRAAPGVNSVYGIWLKALEGLGVSSNPDAAYKYQFVKLPDLIGLQFHRMKVEYDMGNGRKAKYDVPTDVFGFDNEVRADAGLPPAYFKDAEVAATTSRRGR